LTTVAFAENGDYIASVGSSASDSPKSATILASVDRALGDEFKPDAPLYSEPCSEPMEMFDEGD